MVHTHPVLDMDKHFIIDPITRSVTNAESKKTLLMQNDHNSERFSFEIDRMVEGHDLTLCNKIEVHYANVDSNKKNKSYGVYEVNDLEVSSEDENKLIFTWLVSQNATIHAGSLSFLVLFACVEKGETTYRWNSGINTSIAIAKGMNNGEAIEEAYPDILTQWKQDLFAAIYGMETTHVGPTEPETYPYIWFDTSEYFDDPEKNIGQIVVKDANGNVSRLYPVTKLLATDGANLLEELEAQAKRMGEIEETFKTQNEAINTLKSDTEEALNNLNEANNQAHTELQRNISAKASTATYYGTLSSTGWSSEVPYTQTVAVEGILETDVPFVDVDMSSVTSTDENDATVESWNFVSRVTANAGTITAYCYSDLPYVDLKLILKVVR